MPSSYISRIGVFNSIPPFEYVLLHIVFLICSRFVIRSQSKTTSAVDGKVKAQCIQKSSFTTGKLSHCSIGMANSAAKKVAGRNAIVMTAIVFIDELSSFVAFARSMLACTSARVIRLKSCQRLDRASGPGQNTLRTTLSWALALCS